MEELLGILLECFGEPVLLLIIGNGRFRALRGLVFLWLLLALILYFQW